MTKNQFAFAAGLIALLLLAAAFFVPAGFRQAQFAYPGVVALAVALVIGFSHKAELSLFAGLAAALGALTMALLDLLVISPLWEKAPFESAAKQTIILSVVALLFLLPGWSVLVRDGFRSGPPRYVAPLLVFIALAAGLIWSGWTMAVIWAQLPAAASITVF